mgnify:CR=1 FL=1
MQASFVKRPRAATNKPHQGRDQHCGICDKQFNHPQAWACYEGRLDQATGETVKVWTCRSCYDRHQEPLRKLRQVNAAQARARRVRWERAYSARRGG